MLLYVSPKKTRQQPQLLTCGSITLLDGGPDPPVRRRPTNKEMASPTTKETTETERTTSPPPEHPLKQQSPTSSSSSKTSSARKHRRRRHVRFDSVELQEYAVTVGDHPFCKGHFPLTLDWSHTSPRAYKVMDYEAQKARRHHHRRSYSDPDQVLLLEQLHMNVGERWERLRLVTGMTERTLVDLEQSRHHHVIGSKAA